MSIYFFDSKCITTAGYMQWQSARIGISIFLYFLSLTHKTEIMAK